MDARNLGPYAEARAEAYLRSKGYAILDRGYREKFGEIDLVCRRGGAIVFVEVKARSSEGFGGPERSVTRAKRRRLAKTAAAYLKSRRPAFSELRFDVVTLGPGGLTHLENAFESPLRFTF